MMRVSVAEAKNKLTQLIQAVEKGERVTVCRHGKPVVDIVPTGTAERKKRTFGGFKDTIIVRDPDWNRPQNDVEAWLRGDV